MMMSIHLRSRNERLLILVSRSLEVQQDDTQLSQIASTFVSVVQARFVPTNGLLGSELSVRAVHPFS